MKKPDHNNVQADQLESTLNPPRWVFEQGAAADELGQQLARFPRRPRWKNPIMRIKKMGLADAAAIVNMVCKPSSTRDAQAAELRQAGHSLRAHANHEGYEEISMTEVDSAEEPSSPRHSVPHVFVGDINDQVITQLPGAIAAFCQRGRGRGDKKSMQALGRMTSALLDCARAGCPVPSTATIQPEHLQVPSFVAELEREGWLKDEGLTAETVRHATAEQRRHLTQTARYRIRQARQVLASVGVKS